jgi:hypothetical protein
MTVSAGIAFYVAWPFAFITPVLTAKLLSFPKVMPVKKGLVLVGLLSGSFLMSAKLLMPTVNYPIVHLLIVGLIVFLLSYGKAGGMNPLVVVFALIGVTAVPLIGTVSQALADGVAWGLTFAAFVAVAMVYLSAAVFPDPPELGPTVAAESSSAEDRSPAGVSPSASDRLGQAVRSWLVIFPLYVAFVHFSAVEQAVILIYAVLLGLESNYGKHWAAGKGMLLSNLVGGLVAVILYNLLVWVPAFPFFLLLMVLAGLVVGQLIYSGTVVGKLLAGGITTVFIVLGPTLTGDAEAGAKLYVRVLQIFAAVTYVVVAFGVLERLNRGRRVVA